MVKVYGVYCGVQVVITVALFCQSKVSWKFSAGLYFDEIIQEKIIKDLRNPFIDGITLSGGDSMHPRNVINLLPFVQRIKKELPNKTVWCYTGYTSLNS